MADGVVFFSHASGTSGNKENWYKLVAPDDGTDPFVEHAWAIHNADGATLFNGESSISVSDFLSEGYPEEAKMSLRRLLRSKSLGSSECLKDQGRPPPKM
jgi:hypothetical protein